MARALSEDLRIRVIEAVAGGASRRQAAARFGVGVSSAVRWVDRWRKTGETGARKQGGDRRSRLKAHREVVLGLIDERPDLTIEEVRSALGGRGILASYGAVWRFFAAEGISFKKNRSGQRAGSARRGGRAPTVAAGTATS